MKPILQNLVEMTGHRDHLRLEVSVLSTIEKLTGILAVRSLEIFTLGDVLHVRPRTWRGPEDWVSTDEDAAKDPRREPLSNYPELQACVLDHGALAKASGTVGGKKRYTLWLPVWMNDKVTTCLEVSQVRRFSAHRIDVMIGIFSVYQNYQSLLDYSERDALTDLYNRKTFDEQFARHASTRADDAEAPTAQNQQWLAVIDIDHFKQVNDRFGHLYGDEVLILMANTLRSSFRPHDRIFRFGGEEFVVLLRSTNLATAQQIFNRFRKTVENQHFPQVGRVTVSVGFVSTAAGSSVEILGQADQALYFAKENGRNQVRYYGDLVAQGLLQTKVHHDDVELF
ncbi:MAG: GGDEF domain-containing protein [Burkholderiaceae bacterium]|nr:GGDEF domain-containing protein [Burkholderiaceae bacterium]